MVTLHFKAVDDDEEKELTEHERKGREAKIERVLGQANVQNMDIKGPGREMTGFTKNDDLVCENIDLLPLGMPSIAEDVGEGNVCDAYFC